MRFWKPLGVLPLALLMACASTAYRKNVGRSGGYQDQRIDDATFAVKFYGNHSSDLTTRNNLMLRCAVLTTEHGYSYFNPVEAIEGNSNEMTVVIRLTNEPGPASYDSALIKERFANLVNCRKANNPAVDVDLPGLGKPCQPALSVLSADLAESNIEKSRSQATRLSP